MVSILNLLNLRDPHSGARLCHRMMRKKTAIVMEVIVLVSSKLLLPGTVSWSPMEAEHV
jgi:hypothetical protein